MERVLVSDEGAVARAVEVLASGGVVMHPTETCYGLAVDVFNEEAVKKLYEVKRMAWEKPVSVLVDGVGMAEEYGLFDDVAFDLARMYWPGALSLVLPRKRNLPEFLNRKEEFVSLRFSSDAFCTAMVRELGRPVTTTSANVSGELQFYDALELEGVDLLIDGGHINENRPSTIVKVDGGRVEVLRQGELDVLV